MESLKSLESALISHKQDVIRALAEDLSKPEVESFLAEYYFVLQELRHTRKHLRKWLKPVRVGSPFYFLPARNTIHREPFGCALIISPWNYPIQLALSPLIAAIASGNTAILKPSEMAPASSVLLEKIITECFPPELVSVVTGGKEVSESLLQESFNFIFFTGSTSVGRTVAMKAAESLTPCVLELGGKCPCIVDKSADLKIAARRILIGKLFNAGQTCFSPDFVAVQTDVREALVEHLSEELMKFPWEQEIARIVNQKHYSRLQDLVSGTVLSKGPDNPERLHLAPRILPDEDWSSAAMQDEIFGPILPVVTYSDSADLIRKLRNYSTPLALYCFSKNQDFIRQLLENVPSGGACINDVAKQGINPALPFGGSGASGHGRYRGKAGIMSFTQQRTVTRRYFFPDPFEMVPPRMEASGQLQKWLK